VAKAAQAGAASRVVPEGLAAARAVIRLQARAA